MATKTKKLKTKKLKTKKLKTKKLKTIDVDFTSVWDGDCEVTKPAKYDPNDGEINVLEYEEDCNELEHLEDQYIELLGGKQIQVCMHCNDYTVDDKGICRGCGEVHEGRED